MKTCKRCNNKYEFEMFGKNITAKDGYRNICKQCTKNALKTTDINIIITCTKCGKDKEYINFIKHTKICRSCRNKTIIEKRNQDRENYNRTQREWRSQNKDAINSKKRIREKERRDTDPVYRLRHNLSTRLYMAVQYKSCKTMDLTGCCLEDLKKHLESKFTDDMSWENYGDRHIDHIRPCASFNLEDNEEQKKCFHWTNLQPLWAKDNMSKGCKFT